MPIINEKTQKIMKALEQNINVYPKNYYHENAFLIDFYGVRNGNYNLNEETMRFVKDLEKEYLENVKDAKFEMFCIKVGDSREKGGARNLLDLLRSKNTEYYSEWFIYQTKLGVYNSSFGMEHTRCDDHPFDEFSETVDENYLISIAEVKANLAEPELQGSYSFSDFAFPGVNGPKYDELFMPDKAWFEWRMKEQLFTFLQQSALLSERYAELSKTLGERDAVTAYLVEKENPNMVLSAEKWTEVMKKNNHVEKEYYERTIANEMSRIEKNNDIQGFEELLKSIDRPYMLDEYTKSRVEKFAQKLIDEQYMEIADGKFIALEDGQNEEQAQEDLDFKGPEYN